VIDVPTFTALRESVGDEFADELVDTFLLEAPVILAALRSAMEEGDADGYRRAAHSLKANGNTFGALQFASVAGAIEQRGFSVDRGSDVAVADALDAAYAAAAAELTALRRTSEPDLDPAVLADVEARFDADFVSELVDTFVHQSRELIVQIADAVGTGDVSTLRRLAHSLKSSSASVGAVALAARAAEIEGLAREGDLDAAALLVPALDPHFGRVQRNLAERPGG
jgi:HPt (histidine-containing phosphotransfer) domain-containing protein